VRTLRGPATYAEEIKRSRFVARAARIDAPAEALARLAELSDTSADHNCWAYRQGQQYRFSDDGEPGGTAGRPILAAIDSQGIDNVLVVVARHFGGIKLGAGGLVRAYGGSAASCLARAEIVEVHPTVDVVLHIPFDAIGAVYVLLDRAAVKRRGERYGESGLELEVTVVEDELEAFGERLRDASGGRAKTTRQG
jgi:uncharacterized YigZ family protein